MNQIDIDDLSLDNEFKKIEKEYGNSLILKEILHKVNEENVFIRGVKCIRKSEICDSIVTLFRIPLDHSYF